MKRREMKEKKRTNEDKNGMHLKGRGDRPVFRVRENLGKLLDAAVWLLTGRVQSRVVLFRLIRNI